jgi:hypothetical protein
MQEAFMSTAENISDNPISSPRGSVNLEQYPLTDNTSDQYFSLVEQARQQMYEEACVLPNFIKPEFVSVLAAEAEALKDQAFFKTVTGNAYLTDLDDSFDAEHPRSMVEDTSLGVIAYDQVPQGDLIRQIYEWQPLLKFVQDVINKGDLYPYGCPLGALNLSVMREGDYLRWHFDQSDFVVSIAIQDPEAGGEFESVTRLRSADDERYEEVKRVLNGERGRVKTLPVTPGSLVFFQGKHTLHRVTPIQGKRLRVVALLSYDFVPDSTGSDYLKEIRYGRTG